MQALEKALDNVFKAVPPLPEAGRKAIAQFAPWVALIVGVISLYLAWNAYQLTTLISNTYSMFGYSVAPTLGMYGPMLWASIALLVVQAVLMLAAFSPLRTFKKNGWNLLLWGALLSVVYDALFNLFSGYVNIGQFVFSLIGSAIGLYLLFQIRGYYGASAAK